MVALAEILDEENARRTGSTVGLIFEIPIKRKLNCFPRERHDVACRSCRD